MAEIGRQLPPIRRAVVKLTDIHTHTASIGNPCHAAILKPIIAKGRYPHQR